MFKLTREDLINYVKEIIEFISLIRTEKKMEFSNKIIDFEIIYDFETIQKLKNFIDMSYAYGGRIVSKNNDIIPIIKAKSTDGFDLVLNTNVLTIKLKDEIIQMYANSHPFKRDKFIHIRIVKCVEENSFDKT